MRPIDADALIEKCGDWYVEEGTESGFIGTLKNLLATMPTIQPVATDANVGNNSEIPNSSDAISRQQAIDIVVFECGKWTGLAKEISKRLKRLSPAQPERAEGKWSDGYRWQRCSLCKQTGKKSWNYCPNCGAKMAISK